MKEHMDDYYFDAYYIVLEHIYRKWDPHIFHWIIFDIILDAYVIGPHNDLLSQMYKNFHDSLMKCLIDVVMYFHYLYFLLMMFGRVTYQQWNPGIALFHLIWSSSSIVGLRKQTNLQLFEFIFVEKCSSFVCGRPFERQIQFSHALCSWNFIIDISHDACIRIIWDPGIIFGLIGFNFGGNKQHWRFIHHLRR